ncbi:hypothetical protein LTR10_013934 [Elasticomyces elasticus]|nr:hypothetical protein LTR10_013934 [Elasticomyces elasticus]
MASDLADDVARGTSLALLKRQQRRLVSALHEMASIIAKYEGKNQQADTTAKPDVWQLLEKYASAGAADDSSSDEGSLSSSGDVVRRTKRRGKTQDDNHSKRPRTATDPNTAGPAFAPELQQSTMPEPRRPHHIGQEPPFILQPGPNFCTAPGKPEDAHEAMLRFYQLTNSNPQSSEAVAAAPTYPATATGFTSTPADPTNWLMGLVDWRGSLENLPEFSMDDWQASNGDYTFVDETTMDPSFLDGLGQP